MDAKPVPQKNNYRVNYYKNLCILHTNGRQVVPK